MQVAVRTTNRVAVLPGQAKDREERKRSEKRKSGERNELAGKVSAFLYHIFALSPTGLETYLVISSSWTRLTNKQLRQLCGPLLQTVFASEAGRKVQLAAPAECYNDVLVHRMDGELFRKK